MIAYGRTETIDKAIGYFRQRQGRLIVELGSIRQRGNVNGDGYSTIAWAQCAEEVYSIDINPAATALTEELTRDFTNVIAITQDGIEFLQKFGQSIDLLYLDAWDAFLPGSQENHLYAYLAAQELASAITDFDRRHGLGFAQQRPFGDPTSPRRRFCRPVFRAQTNAARKMLRSS